MFNWLSKSPGASAPERVEPQVVAPQVSTSMASGGLSFEQLHQKLLGFAGSEVSRETAMKLTAVSACVSLIAGAIGTTPLRVHSRNNAGEVIEDHELHALLHEDPHPLYSAEVWMEALEAIALLEGNSYAVIERNRNGRAMRLRPVLEGSVDVRVKNGNAVYVVTENGDRQAYFQDDILHFRGSAAVRGFLSLAPIKSFRDSMQIGLFAQTYAKKYYEQGTLPSGYISYEGKASAEQRDEIREYWGRKHAGLENAHLPAVLTESGKFHKMMTDPETAQLLQSRSFSAEDVARAYGVPPHLIGITTKSTSWGSGIESQTTQFYMLALRKPMKRNEGEFRRKLLGAGSEYAVRYDLDSFLRADVKSRYAAHASALGGTQAPGWRTVNEVREMEGLPPLDQPEANLIYGPALAGDGVSGDPATGGEA